MIGQKALEFIHLEDQKDFVKQFCSRAPIRGQLALPASANEPMDIGGRSNHRSHLVFVLLTFKGRLGS